MIRVLLADDHAIVIEGLRALLDGEPDIKVAAWTTDGTEVVKLVEQHKPDVVVLDLELVLLDELDDFRAVGGPGRDFDVGFAVEQRAQALEHDRVVVGHQHADHDRVITPPVGRR